MHLIRVGQKHTYIVHTYTRCTYGILSREITICTVKYGVHVRFWPTLHLILCLVLLHSSEGCHQCKSNPANLVSYGSGLDENCATIECSVKFVRKEGCGSLHI
jgi:hypothetical protein